MLRAVPQSAEEVSKVFEQLIYAEDHQRSDETFWRLWAVSAERVVSASDRMDIMKREHNGLSRFTSVLLFDHIYWKENARDWEPIHGNEWRVAEFFAATGSSPSVFQSFVRVLDSVGNKALLPDALRWLHTSLLSGDAKELLGERDTLFHLTRILTPIIYGRTAATRKAADLRDAILHILRGMIDAGSSAAFRMREFFISPASPEHC